MIISYQWLLEYLPNPIPVDDLSKILTSVGLEVEAVEKTETIKGGLEGLIIGEVLTCAPHPNADKLKVTTVNVGNGGEPLNIVCGAPNVAAGQKVIVATVGTTVHPLDGASFLIKKAKIRGEASEGMICAEDEIGLGHSHDGIIILPETAVVGTLARDYYNIAAADFAIHIGLTPNRSDANSHIGVAKDVCAYLTHHNGGESDVKMPAVNAVTNSNTSPIKVVVENTEACPRYMGLCIEGVKVGPSPDWLQQKLQTVGSRSINNVVDVTNYILQAYGQPLHAFDAAKITGNEVHVGFKPEGTTFITLDGKERKLQSTDLMISNAAEGMCIAGVFGGAESGITDGTTSVFLESAYFNPTTIRRTSLHHGLRTDAATHFEKGIDINNLEPALLHAAQMILEIAGGQIVSPVIDVYPTPFKAEQVAVTFDYINKLSGKEYSKDATVALLTALGFGVANKNEEGMVLDIPSNKTDVHQPADIVEEILRIDGLDNVVIPDRLNISLSKALPNDRGEREKAAQSLCGMGFQEIITNSIVNSKYYPEATNLVKMLNSLSSELDVMRPSLLESGLEVVSWNVNRKSQDLLLFEMGNIYRQEEGKYLQEPQLALFATGNGQSANWNGKAVKADLYFLKGVIQNLLKLAGIVASLSFDEEKIVWKWKNQTLCTLVQVPSKRLQTFDIKQEVFFAVIEWNLWMKAVTANKIKFSEVPKFPAVQRDLALVLDKSVAYKQVQQVTEKLKLQGLQSFDLFDVFESEKLGAGKKSLALNYTFQLQDRTLTDTETETLMKQLTEAYRKELGAMIRE